MKIVQGIQIKVNVESKDDFIAYIAGQVSIKEVTGFHSATFNEKEKEATIVYINDSNPKTVVRGQKVVEVYVN